LEEEKNSSPSLILKGQFVVEKYFVEFFEKFMLKKSEDHFAQLQKDFEVGQSRSFYLSLFFRTNQSWIKNKFPLRKAKNASNLEFLKPFSFFILNSTPSNQCPFYSSDFSL